MKPVRLLLLFSMSFTAALANAQTVQHVIVVIQENRTPDNPFALASQLIASGANVWNINTVFPCKLNGFVGLLAAPLDVCFDPNHGHAQAWETIYDGGAMDGACANTFTQGNNCSPPQYPADTYVDNSSGILNPYFQIATTYGFANYMFQTNQGPSFPAHQFLFGGTSAPVPFGDPTGLWAWFAGENPVLGGNPTYKGGCAAPTGTQVEDINPNNGGESYQYTPPGFGTGFPCYNHNTLAGLLDSVTPTPITWRYYAPGQGNNIWTAPNALQGICQLDQNGNCSGQEWSTHVKLFPTDSGDYAPILSDIVNCKLAGVSWSFRMAHGRTTPVRLEAMAGLRGRRRS